MRLRPERLAAVLLATILPGSLAVCQITLAADLPAVSPHNALSTLLLDRAKAEFERTKALVEQGTLPRARLEQAQLKLDDAQDEQTLADTLYSGVRLQDLTAKSASAMIEAAEKRVTRQAGIVEDRRTLLQTGILAQSEFNAYLDELDARRRVLDLARDRVQLYRDLQQMAEAEQRLASQSVNKDVMIRYEGNGIFKPTDLSLLSDQYQQRFHRTLPVSANGQTLTHQQMGLDHRGRVDIALNPDQPEGVWLRQLLERLHIPYLAFRSALAGAATAPHIHIGSASSHLKLAQR